MRSFFLATTGETRRHHRPSSSTAASSSSPQLSFEELQRARIETEEAIKDATSIDDIRRIRRRGRNQT
jgi:hypothetical protein